MSESRLDFVRWCLTSTDLNETPNDEADHFVKKAVAFEIKGQERTGFPDAHSMQCSHGIGDRGSAIRCEGGKVVPPGEQLHGSCNKLVVDRVANMPGAVVFQGRKYFVIPDAIA